MSQLPVRHRISGISEGATAPARFPIMFIDPDKVPAYLPPTSMAVAQAWGITRSLQKLAKPINRIADDRMSPPGSTAPAESAAPTKAAGRDQLCGCARAPPTQLTTYFETQPENRQPTPPRKRGRVANRATSTSVRWRRSPRYVGSQVM